MKTWRLSWTEKSPRSNKEKKQTAHYRTKEHAERARDELLKDCYDINIDESSI